MFQRIDGSSDPNTRHSIEVKRVVFMETSGREAAILIYF